MANLILRRGLRTGGLVLTCVVIAVSVVWATTVEAQAPQDVERKSHHATAIAYLEFVTTEVDAVCQTYERLHGVEFGQPVASLGNARTAKSPTGGLVGVRGPLRQTERPVVRSYLLVNNIEAAVTEAAAEGAQIALPPMELPGYGKCAIFIQGGVEHGLWQDEKGTR